MDTYTDTTIQTRGDEDQAATLNICASPEEFGNKIVLHAAIPMESSTMLVLTVTEACAAIKALNDAINLLADADA